MKKWKTVPVLSVWEAWTKSMLMHYIIQGIFVVVGMLTILASLFNWDWFFKAQNMQAIVRNVGRNRARLFYALLGILMIATAIYFFGEVQKTIA